MARGAYRPWVSSGCDCKLIVLQHPTELGILAWASVVCAIALLTRSTRQAHHNADDSRCRRQTFTDRLISQMNRPAEWMWA